MIKSSVHKGLERFYHAGSKVGIQPRNAMRLRRILGRLDVAACPGDMELPGFSLHELKGSRKGTWAVTVQANRRILVAATGRFRPLAVTAACYRYSCHVRWGLG